MRVGLGGGPIRRVTGRHSAVRAGQNRLRRPIRGSRYGSRPLLVRSEGRWNHLSVDIEIIELPSADNPATEDEVEELLDWSEEVDPFFENALAVIDDLLAKTTGPDRGGGARVDSSAARGL